VHIEIRGKHASRHILGDPKDRLHSRRMTPTFPAELAPDLPIGPYTKRKRWRSRDVVGVQLASDRATKMKESWHPSLGFGKYDLVNGRYAAARSSALAVLRRRLCWLRPPARGIYRGASPIILPHKANTQYLLSSN